MMLVGFFLSPYSAFAPTDFYSSKTQMLIKVLRT